MIKKLSIIKDANYWYERYEVPSDAWVHGRYGQKELRKNVVIQGTQDWSVAESYSGKNGSMWLFVKKGGTKLADTNSIRFSEQVWNKLKESYKKGSLSVELDEYMGRVEEKSFYEELDPKDIVDSAGIWDMMDFVEWFSDRFKYDGVLTEGGGIVILNPKKFNYSMVKQ